MSTMPEAIIYLGENRGHVENEQMRSLLTFNFGNYKAANREPFGSLQVFNEDTLGAGQHLQMVVEEYTEVLIIPLVGTLLFTDEQGHSIYINPGSVQLFAADMPTSYTIANPYENGELVNFLQVWLYKKRLDLQQKKNCGSLICCN